MLLKPQTNLNNQTLSGVNTSQNSTIERGVQKENQANLRQENRIPDEPLMPGYTTKHRINTFVLPGWMCIFGRFA